MPRRACLHRTGQNTRPRKVSAAIYWTGARDQAWTDSVACVFFFFFFRADTIYEDKAIGVKSEAARETEDKCPERGGRGQVGAAAEGVLGGGWCWLQGVRRRGLLTKIS